MQTFLPYSDFELSASVLDRMRLGKQRVEGFQLLKTLLDDGGWSNHPAAKMWAGYEAGLARYTIAVCTEWVARGYRDSCDEKIRQLCFVHYIDLYDEGLPPWLGDEHFHLSHKSNLIRKLPEHYGPLWPDVPDDLSYVWPVHA